MRRSTQALALALLPVLGLVACAEQAGQEEARGDMDMSMAMDPMELRSAIESAAANWDRAFNAGDAAGLAALYTDDATLLPAGSDMVEGSEAIREFWAGFIAEAPEGAIIDLETVDVHGAGNLAYEVGTFSVTAGGEPIDAGKYVVVWRHEPDGSWKLFVDIWNRNEPMESMEM